MPDCMHSPFHINGKENGPNLLSTQFLVKSNFSLIRDRYNYAMSGSSL